jgi:4-oxalocrotonate tautomerase
MPYINLRLGTTLDDSQRNQLAKRTASLMQSIMGKRPEVTVVHLQESAPHFWSVNGSALKPNDPFAAYVDIKVTAGTNTPEEKAEMLSETISMLQDVLGVIQEACYVVIDDIPANSWGFNGRTQAERAAAQA